MQRCCVNPPPRAAIILSRADVELLTVKHSKAATVILLHRARAMQHRPLAQRRAGIPRFVWSRGIYLGWWITGVLALVSLARVAFFNPVLSIFVDLVEDQFGWRRTTIAGALSAGTIIATYSSPFLGQLIDRYGAACSLLFS